VVALPLSGVFHCILPPNTLDRQTQSLSRFSRLHWHCGCIKCSTVSLNVLDAIENGRLWRSKLEAIEYQPEAAATYQLDVIGFAAIEAVSWLKQVRQHEDGWLGLRLRRRSTEWMA